MQNTINQKQEEGFHPPLVSEYCFLKQTVSDFVSFLRFCAVRLDRGEQVPSIWHDFLQTEN